MPNYDYFCSSCKRQFEIFQSMNEPQLTCCPNCHKESVRRMISGGGVIFKGSGFYVTDNRSTESS